MKKLLYLEVYREHHTDYSIQRDNSQCADVTPKESIANEEDELIDQ